MKACFRFILKKPKIVKDLFICIKDLVNYDAIMRIQTFWYLIL